ncbi:hypothetical protein PoB_001150500 [Plakobranchus ocellatus]|uniref:Uncharacterized protein n=1 Tax=Plakobranchus ocellatus TaxID=259542 RepID=A0AAV3YRD1_9GAST|nr:hypothetical protein PoB_001150500 [Plakobranchus ocellatus]
MKPSKLRTICNTVVRGDTVLLFHAIATHAAFARSGSSRFGFLICASSVWGESYESIPHVLFEYLEMSIERPAEWAALTLDDILLRQDRDAMSTAANILRVFLLLAMQ